MPPTTDSPATGTVPPLTWEQCAYDPPAWRAHGRRWTYLLLRTPDGRVVLTRHGTRPGPFPATDLDRLTGVTVNPERQALMAAAYARPVASEDAGRLIAAQFDVRGGADPGWPDLPQVLPAARAHAGQPS